MAELAITSDLVATPEGLRPATVLIDGGRVVAVVPPGRTGAQDEVSADGLLVMPGAVDQHVHLELRVMGVPTADDWASGSRAALFGGTTTVVDFAEPAADGSLQAGLAEARRRAEGRAVVDFALHMTVTDAAPARLAELAAVRAAGVTSLKTYLAYPDRLMLDDAGFAATLRRAAELGLLVMVHAEQGREIEALIAEARARGDLAPAFHAATRPPWSEARAVDRVIRAARETGAEVLLAHLSTAEGAGAVAAARAVGLPVHGETCPHYLWLEAARLGWEAPAGLCHVCAPPLRTVAHLHALWQALAAGALEAVSTDHCPFDWHGGKDRGDRPPAGDFTRTPGGLPGVECRLPLLFAGGVASGRFDLQRFVDLVSTGPARLMRLFPRKGAIAPGADADLVLFDPTGFTDLSAAALHHRLDHSPWEGMSVRGEVAAVIRAGRIVVWQGKEAGPLPAGQYLARKAA